MMFELLKLDTSQENFQSYLFHLSEISLTAELFLSCSILQFTFYSISTTTQRKYGFILLSTQVYSIGALILFLSSLLLLNEDLLTVSSLSANNSVLNDYLSFSVKLVICITSVLYILVLKINSKDEPIQHNFEYIVLVLLSVLGSLLICSSNDLLTAYLSIELQSVSFYLMAAFKKNSSYSIESGLKYFIIGSLSSAFFLFGSSIVYGCTGSLNFQDIKIFYSLLTTNYSYGDSLFYSVLAYKTQDIYNIFLPYYELLFIYNMMLGLTVEDNLVPILQDYFFYTGVYTTIPESGDLFSWVYQNKGGNSMKFSDYSFIFYSDVSLFDQAEKEFDNFIEAMSLLRRVNFNCAMEFVKSEYFRQTSYTALLFGGATTGNVAGYLFFSVFSSNMITDSCFITIPPVFTDKLLNESLVGQEEYLYYNAFYKTGIDKLIQNSNYSEASFYSKFLEDIWYSTTLSVENYLHLVDKTNVNIELLSIGFILICVSLFIKLALSPFHFWSLDVYEGSPSYTTAFFAIVPKIAIFVLLFRICYLSFFNCFYNQWQTWFFLIAVLSIFVGSVGGLEQRKLKTLLAYSSINHTGYLMLAFSSGSTEGVILMFYYLTIFMISGLCFWSVFLFLRPKKDRYLKKNNRELGDLVLLRESNPMLAFILSITLFSLAGIPPLVGFLAKVGVFLSAIGSSAYLISVVSILLSVISTFYYIRVIKILYFENTLVGKLYLPISTNKAFLISIFSLMLILLSINPTMLYLFFVKAGLLSVF